MSMTWFRNNYNDFGQYFILKFITTMIFSNRLFRQLLKYNTEYEASRVFTFILIQQHFCIALKKIHHYN